MTSIEELWSKAKNDPATKRVNGTLEQEAKTYCGRCMQTLTVRERATCTVCAFIPENANGN